MRLEYQLTFEDFREAHQGPRPAAPPRPLRRWAGLFSWLLFIALAVLVLTLVKGQPANRRRGRAAPPPPPPAPAEWRLAAAVGPSLVFFGVMAAVTFRQMRRPFPKPWEQPPPPDPRLRPRPNSPTAKQRALGLLIPVGVVAAAAAATVLYEERARRSGAASGPPPWRLLTGADFLPGLVPWAMMVGLLALVARWNRHDRGLRKIWDAQPFLHAPHALDVSDAAGVISDPLSRLEYRWESFAGFKETPNLLLLYVSALSLHIIPKRAFATPDQLDAFRGLLLNRVEHGHFLEQPSAFAVVPFAVPAGGPSRGG